MIPKPDRGAPVSKSSTLIVPAQDLQHYTSELQNHGLNVDSSFPFKDLRGGQEGTGDE